MQQPDAPIQPAHAGVDAWDLPEEAGPQALHVCISAESACQELGENLVEQIRKQLLLSLRLRPYRNHTEVSLLLLTQDGWSVPECEVLIPLLSPEWLLTPIGVAALRSTFLLRSMHLGPELLPLVHSTSFSTKPDGLSRALNSPSAQLLREAATPGSWGCLDTNMSAAVEQAAAWAVTRVEALFAWQDPGSEGSSPQRSHPRNDGGSGLTQTTWRRSNNVVPLAADRSDLPEAVWQDHAQFSSNSPKRPANMPSLRAAAGTDRRRPEPLDKASLRQAAEASAQQAENLQRQGAQLPRRASEPLPSETLTGLKKTVAGKDWAEAMRDALGVPDAAGAFPQGTSRHGSKESAHQDMPPLPSVGPPIPSQLGSRKKGRMIPPLPDRPPRPASALSAKGHCRRRQPWRAHEFGNCDDSLPEQLPEGLLAAATVRHWATLALEQRPRTPGRTSEEPQSAPATPKGREEDWDHFGLLDAGFYTAEAMSPSALRSQGLGLAAPDPFTGETMLSWAKTGNWDPSSTWWGAHPAETCHSAGRSPSQEAPQEEAAAEGGCDPDPKELAGAERNRASKVDAMMSLQVELPPLPGQALSSDLLAAGGAMPAENNVVELSLGSLELGTQLLHAKGGGSYGPKFIALNLKLNRRVVCWRFVAPKHLEMARRALLKDSVAEEVLRLRSLRHECLCPYFAGEVIDDELYVVTGYAPGGSVADWLADAGPLAEAACRRVIRSVLQGLKFLHSNAVAHGAVRGGNVLLGPGAAIRLCDFGLVALRSGSNAGSAPKTAQTGTALSQSAVPWMSPEVLEGAKPSPASDVWSLGCLVAELSLAKPIALGAPFRARANSAPLMLEELEDSIFRVAVCH
ncbi:unnamed protein product [Effrenium voratum]|uniref:Protein kinase domain-containing protein n=1 Tax=Effrenium voratum TaxID=2562239 RepID=A0AA36NDG4_9DINO|nr:unnamed protein product [Effrenium voratum]